MKIIKWILWWMLLVFMAVTAPIFSLCGYNVKMEFTHKDYMK